jgi:hypothetical protein
MTLRHRVYTLQGNVLVSAAIVVMSKKNNLKSPRRFILGHFDSCRILTIQEESFLLDLSALKMETLHGLENSRTKYLAVYGLVEGGRII